MKRIIKLSIILLIVMIACSGIVYAAPSCNISLETTSSEFNKNDTFSVNVKMSNIVSEKGMIALEAVLEYDKESLTLLKMEGQNEWSNPVKDLSYNEGTGKLVIDKDGLAKSDEVILKLTFKVNENSKKNLMISLKEIKVSDTTVPTKLNNNAYKNITVMGGQDNPVPTPDPNPNPNPNPTPDAGQNSTQNSTQDSTQSQTPNKNVNTNKVDSLAKNKIPHAGTSSLILVLLVAVIAVLFFYFKIKKVNKQINK